MENYKKLPENLIGVIKTIKNYIHEDSVVNDEKKYQENSIIEEQYDKNGRITQSFKYIDNKITKKEFYLYDDFGNLLEYNEYSDNYDFDFKDEDGLVLICNEEYKYNENNDLVYEGGHREISSEHADSFVRYYEYKYSSDRKILKKIEKNFEKKIKNIEEHDYYENGKIKRTKYTYFNEEGNIVWWRESFFDENELLKENNSYDVTIDEYSENVTKIETIEKSYREFEKY